MPVMLQGAKIGVLGANGAGKSSLMKILAGVDNSFDGKVVRAPGIRSAGGKRRSLKSTQAQPCHVEHVARSISCCASVTACSSQIICHSRMSFHQLSGADLVVSLAVAAPGVVSDCESLSVLCLQDRLP